jgi:flavin-dependent dehydrogenase
LVDAQEFPRDKTCAGWITPQVFEALSIDPMEYAREHVLQPIRGFAIGIEGYPSQPVEYPEVVSYAVRRCELDHYLLRRSETQARLGHRVREIRREDGRWRVDDIEARILVGAGGHFCPVARHLCQRRDPTVIVASEIEVPVPWAEDPSIPVRAELPLLVFRSDLRGYGWVLRKDGWLNVGSGHERDGNRANPGERDSVSFLDRARERGLIPDLDARCSGHAYVTRELSTRPVGAPNVLLVGDAAGLAEPRSGEGIRSAVESGLLAAEAIVLPKSRGSLFGAYRAALRARFGNGTHRLDHASALVPTRWRTSAAGRALAIPAVARLIVDRWFLRRSVPALRRHAA